MKTSSRLLELDALRGIAAISVVLYHYTYGYGVLYGQHNVIISFPYGNLGVHLFFLISGFVIFLTLGKAKAGLDFIVSRFSRLYPAYWVAGGLTFAIVSIFGLPGWQVSWTDGLINLTMLAGWLSTPYIDGVYWTLTIELSFYLLMFVLYLTDNLKRIETFAIGWLILIYPLRIIGYLFKFQIPTPIAATILLNSGFFFIAGIMFYKVKNGQATLKHHLIILCCYLACLNHRIDFDIIYNAAFFVIFYLFAYNRLGFIVHKPLLLLGMISYPLYLIHANIGFVIIRNFYKYNINPNLSVIIALTSVLLMSWLISISIEKPAMKFIRRKYQAASSAREQLNRPGSPSQDGIREVQ
jgi:peptidoglycan/LPS O-acetylase OafA/YrhL